MGSAISPGKPASVASAERHQFASPSNANEVGESVSRSTGIFMHAPLEARADARALPRTHSIESKQKQ